MKLDDVAQHHASPPGLNRRQSFRAASIAATALGTDMMAAPGSTAQGTSPHTVATFFPLPMPHTDADQIPQKLLDKLGMRVSILAMGLPWPMRKMAPLKP